MPADELCAIIEQARCGSADALGQLYDEYASAVFALALRLLASPDEAEDVVQDVFLSLPRALRSYSHRGAFLSWLRTTAARDCIARLRRRGRRMRIRRTGLVIDRSAPPAQSETYLVIQDAVLSLPDRYRTVFVLKVLEGYTHDEIAQLLGISVTSSRARLSRARTTLRRLLKDRL